MTRLPGHQKDFKSLVAGMYITWYGDRGGPGGNAKDTPTPAREEGIRYLGISIMTGRIVLATARILQGSVQNIIQGDSG